ncbi:pyrophosphate--fructose-6-phosphate 1-phosphotransferase [Candidatus Liberibacter solanacearum]|uniref:Pyrophosphate--fructose 6-phosphate 1-phosphotransferase, alpha subunit n=1 Tax=Candidatus Liberibacter solanacearum TaxID=556287 RepID=A0A095A171_9HYPH|nr:pyrophosphate--fructose-6-phosphate 1-phosphotransferase [Candidatus Liberibacter solanacearum]KGB27791.1 pyrophosphate--fructose-6-phosphate 1-phosphotransferase [Candidatus Liberibacter solanacearum]KJZ81549.1 pyrophosphate--fructose-6-phosphate 1-phosphotransferase [Candidatus Liberibacter solanacearum]KJZ82454.1 Pyrophosphate--fructose 6-phosphate 1-phosphotransferase, alpha subunit [Candidatus Liberibacter solanacearum]KQC48768.1 pyrophosphate--fructose-6-phosphate 1-phosphotransferase 
MVTHKVAFLTAGGIAPCLSSVIGMLISRYNEILPEAELIAYRSGYQGLLLDDKIEISHDMRQNAEKLLSYGGSPIGNSRIKLTNINDCIKRNLIKENENPLEVAAHNLMKNSVTILHTIGGDDTNTTACDLLNYLKEKGYNITVVGLPKTIDNDIVPIHQSLGALTAAKVSAQFFDNISNERSASPKSLIIHEVMGRNCGWLTAYTARSYLDMIRDRDYVNGLIFSPEFNAIDGIYLPEMSFNLEEETERLTMIMEKKGSVALFVSEGACRDVIVSDRLSSGDKIQRDSFGHILLDKINVGSWFSDKFANLIKAERSIVQKSGYFARSAASSEEDLILIRKMVILAVDGAIAGISGVTGEDERKNNLLRIIEFEDILGGKIFDIKTPWFSDILQHTGQKY